MEFHPGFHICFDHRMGFHRNHRMGFHRNHRMGFHRNHRMGFHRNHRMGFHRNHGFDRHSKMADQYNDVARGKEEPKTRFSWILDDYRQSVGNTNNLNSDSDVKKVKKRPRNRSGRVRRRSRLPSPPTVTSETREHGSANRRVRFNETQFCDECNELFTTKAKYVDHLTRHDDIQITVPNFNPNLSIGTNHIKLQTVLICELCMVFFIMKWMLNNTQGRSTIIKICTMYNKI
uniref:C2H2-type domain-containing protein n=1 Tax=Strigamia maritima TaxID=126957 RepID=T1J1D3_STRMM